MNKSFSEVGKSLIKKLIADCTEPQQRIFKLMYGRDNGKRSVEDAEKLPINDVVDMVKDEHLNRALDQVERTIAKNNKTQQP